MPNEDIKNPICKNCGFSVNPDKFEVSPSV